MSGTFSKIKFGDGLSVADEGEGVILVSASAGGGGGDGIMFDTTPQEGDYLFVTTDEANGSSGNVVFTTVGASGPTTNGKFVVDAAGDILIDSGNESTLGGARVAIGGGAGGVYIEANRSGVNAFISLGNTGDPAGYRWDQCDGDYDLDNHGNYGIYIDTGKTVTVYNNSNQPIFRVDEDGDLHGKTGKALTFDL